MVLLGFDSKGQKGKRVGFEEECFVELFHCGPVIKYDSVAKQC